MRKAIFIMLLHGALECESQNLIPNYSFEYYSTCPWMEAQIFLAPPWHTASLGGTPDYFNSCAIGGLINVPWACGGYQLAKTGSAFAGLYGFVYYPPYYNTREYIQVELTDSLKANSWYCVSFYCNLADVSNYAIDRIGAFISDTAIYRNDTSYFPVTPQIENLSGNFLSAKVNWMEVSGLYQAHGGEKFITIGNFRSDTLTDSICFYNSNGPFAYYFIEDVSIINCDSLMGINDFENYDFSIYPNPTTDKIIISTQPNCFIEKVEIFSVTGEMVFERKLQKEFDIGHLSKGVYIARIQTDKGIAYKKLIIQ